MTKSQMFFKVTLLQMIKRIVPPMSNEIITLVKDTSLARIVALQEIICFWLAEVILHDIGKNSCAAGRIFCKIHIAGGVKTGYTEKKPASPHREANDRKDV